MLDKALTRGADAVIVDLEDGVPDAAKDTARGAAAAWISEHSNASTELWVRLNPSLPLLRSDLDAVVQEGLVGVYLPKASSVEDVETASAMIDRLEDVRGLMAGSIRIAPLLETAASILIIPEIASSARVSHMAIGETDLAADLAMYPSHDGHELNPIRLSVVVASAANGLNMPIGPVQTAFRDLELLGSTSLMLRRMGYRGRAAIHPSQIPVINEAFAPSRGEVESARDILDRFETARAEGAAVTIAKDGSLIDEAVVRRARVTLDAAPQNQGV
jgi:citrate lyase subunit beta/citryl-CoA lyase